MNDLQSFYIYTLLPNENKSPGSKLQKLNPNIDNVDSLELKQTYASINRIFINCQHYCRS